MTFFALSIGSLSAVAFYLLMSKQLTRWFYGLILLSSLINVCILLCGRVYLSIPAFINGSSQPGNPLPQAMVLTAIVISFALISLSLAILRILHKYNHAMRDRPLDDNDSLTARNVRTENG